MRFIRSAAIAASIVLVTTTVALAHNGVVHTGCPYGQTFTIGGITVTGAFIPAVPKGAPTAAAYMRIVDSGDADTLTGATSLAADIGLHQMQSEGSVMKMVPVEGGLPVPASGSASLDPMGYHLMMTGMTQPFLEGQCVQMVLHFAKSGDLPIELNIGGIGSTVAPTGAPSGKAPAAPMDMSGMSSMPGM